MSVMTLADREVVEADSGTEATLAAIVASAVDTVPGAEYAGVSLLHSDGQITSHAPTTDMIAKVDQLQATYQQGPCMAALQEHTVMVDDLDTETQRWPRFAPEALAYGISSMLSFQLFIHGNSLGALNLYSTTRAAFTAESLPLGRLFAIQSALAFYSVQEITQLHRALDTRDVIGQAKGILMQRFGIDTEHAFSILVTSSQQTNMKLTAVARWLTEHITEVPTEF